ncbi:hypothetical protein [Carnobacterium mobile]
MGIKDFESNFKAIKQSLAIDQNRKFELLTTQMETLALLYFDGSEEVTKQEEHQAKILYKNIQLYLKISFSLTGN